MGKWIQLYINLLYPTQKEKIKILLNPKSIVQYNSTDYCYDSYKQNP